MNLQKDDLLVSNNTRARMMYTAVNTEPIKSMPIPNVLMEEVYINHADVCLSIRE